MTRGKQDYSPKTPEEYLEHYYKKYGFNFKEQCWNKYPNPWCEYGTPQHKEYIQKHGFINHREIFPDEIVCDIDCHSEIVLDDIKRQKCLEVGEIISKRLEAEGYSFSYWKSGGLGVHIHLFFPELLLYSKTNRLILKKLFWKKIAPEYLHSQEDEAHICQGNPILIQAELAPHRKGGIKTLIKQHINPEDNTFPLDVLQDYQTKKIDYIKSNDVITLNPDVPRAIQLLETEDFSTIRDGRNRALFVLACYWSHFLDKDQLFMKLDKWNRYQLRGYLNNRQIRATINSVFKREKRPLFPYNYLRNLLEELQLPIDFSDIQFK